MVVSFKLVQNAKNTKFYHKILVIGKKSHQKCVDETQSDLSSYWQIQLQTKNRCKPVNK